MIGILKGLASFLFYSLSVVLLLFALTFAVLFAAFGIKEALKELFGCDFTKYTKGKN